MLNTAVYEFKKIKSENPCIGFLACYGPRSTAQALKTTLATWFSCYLPNARALKTGFLNFRKSPFQASDLVILTILVKIL